MPLSSISYEPWESAYMWFLMPGLLTWIASAIWWTKTHQQWPPIFVQCIGAIEVAIGGAAAFMTGMINMNAIVQNTGSWAPDIDSAERAFLAKIALIGWILHFFLIIGTLIMAFLTKRRTSRKPI